MTEEQQETQIKTKGYKWWQIALVIVGVIVLIVVISRINFNKQFWWFLLIVSSIGGFYLYYINSRAGERKQDIYKIIRMIQFNNDELPNGQFLDTSNVEVKEITPNNFLVHFINNGIIYEVKDNLVTGLEYTNLFNAQKDRERSVLFKEIVREQKKKDAIIERARRLGIDIPEVS